MSLPQSDKIWMNGHLIPWHEARVHVASHVVHYGSAVFEGIRCYSTPEGPAVFRLPDHARRLFESAKIYRMTPELAPEDFSRAVLDTIAVNDLKSCYVRPIVYRGYGPLGVNPLNCPIDVAILVWNWGSYLGPEALEQGVDVCVSSWNRMAPNTFPALAKASGQYLNAQLIKMEALTNGYVEGIALDTDGFVAEGSGENIFVVRDGTLITPPLHASVLAGITRDSIIKLATELGLPVKEQRIPREFLYLADELFFTGTAAEVTPIRSVDKVKIGAGSRGPVTRDLQKAFFDVVECNVPDRYGWLTLVGGGAAVEEAVSVRESTVG